MRSPAPSQLGDECDRQLAGRDQRARGWRPCGCCRRRSRCGPTARMSGSLSASCPRGQARDPWVAYSISGIVHCGWAARPTHNARVSMPAGAAVADPCRRPPAAMPRRGPKAVAARAVGARRTGRARLVWRAVGKDCVLVPLALATWAVTACSVPGHQARYQPFLTVAWTELPSLRVIVTPVTPAPIGPSTIVSACPSESDSPAPLSWIVPAGMLDVRAAAVVRADRDAVALHAGGAVGIDRGGVRARECRSEPACRDPCRSAVRQRRAGRAAVPWGSRSIRRMRARRSIRAGWPRPRQRRRRSAPAPPARARDGSRRERGR